MNLPRLVLGIECATPASSIAIASVEGTLVAQACHENGGPVSELLLNDLERLLMEAGAARSNLEAVAVTLGPGAFTGLRVGLALAKTLAHALNVPLFGFSTLAMLARRWPSASIVASMIDARRNEVYAGLYAVDDAQEPSTPRAVLQDCVAPIEAVLENMEAVLNGRAVVVMGQGALKYREAVDHAWGARALWAPPALMQPAAETVALAGAAALRAGAMPLGPLQAAPVYLRASDAALRHPQGVRTLPRAAT